MYHVRMSPVIIFLTQWGAEMRRFCYGKSEEKVSLFGLDHGQTVLSLELGEERVLFTPTLNN